MSTDLNEQAYEQQLQWSLSEAEGGESPPDVTDKVLAAIEGIGQSVQAPVTRSRWLLTAAIVTLGVAALFGVHHFSLQQGNQVAVTPSPSSNPPTQDPRPKHVRKHLVRDAKEIADLPSDARSVHLWQLSDDDFAAVVERCPKLEEVAASTSGKPNTDLTDRVFTTASKLTNLRKLQLLQVSQVTGEGIEQLAALRRLESLTINWSQLRPSAYEALPALQSIKTLDLSYTTTLEDNAMTQIARCSNIDTLRISHCPNVTAKGLAIALRLPNLRSLDIENLKCSWKEIGNERPAKLRILNATNTQFQNVDLGWLPPDLEELSLNHTGADANTCRILTKMVRHLHKLSLTNCSITDTGVSMLGGLGELHELDITNVPLTEDCLRPLRQMDQLCELKISALNWIEQRHISPLMAAGINVHITEGKGHDRYLHELREAHRAAIAERRDRFMKR